MFGPECSMEIIKNVSDMKWVPSIETATSACGDEILHERIVFLFQIFLLDQTLDTW
jgi:hypothetical protein